MLLLQSYRRSAAVLLVHTMGDAGLNWVLGRSMDIAPSGQACSDTALARSRRPSLRYVGTQSMSPCRRYVQLSSLEERGIVECNRILVSLRISTTDATSP